MRHPLPSVTMNQGCACPLLGGVASSAAAGGAVVDEHAEVGNRPAATDGAGSYWDRPTASTLRKLLHAGGGQQGPHHRIRQVETFAGN